MGFDHVVVMGYRNFAGDPAGDNGLIAVNEDHVNHAHDSQRNRKVLIGLRTTGIHAEGGHPVETFFGSSPMKLHAAKARVERFFAKNHGFGGFATHRYDPSGLATSFPALAVNDSGR